MRLFYEAWKMLDANLSVATDESQSTIAIVASSQESSVATLTNVRRHQCRYAHRRILLSSGLIAFSPSGVYLRPIVTLFTSLCYITLFRHFVYAILFKSLRLLRLHLMQASALPSFTAFITFGYYPDSGSMRAADSVYASHIYMPSPCFPLKFVLSCIYFMYF